MGISDKSLLVVTEDSEVFSRAEAALKPLVKIIAHAKNADEAIKKAQNQVFDAFLLRTKQPSLTDPKHVYQWAKEQKGQKESAWVVLGKDIEDESIVVKDSRIKFLADPNDGTGLVRVLNGLFFALEDSKSSGGIDVSFINPLVGAVVEVLKTMATIELNRGQPFIRQSTDTGSTKSDVSGIIAMNSDRFLGSMAICFEKSLALKAYENMLGTAAPDINDDVRDAVSEMTNIIFGNAKRDLNVAGHTIAPAIPSVISGPAHQIRHSVGGHRFCVPFSSSFGSLVVECVISPK